MSMIKRFLHLLFVFGFASLLLGCTSTDVTEDEKALLITIEDLAAQGVPVGSPTQAGVKYAARRFINGTTEIEYEYDSENDPSNPAIVIFFSEADTQRNEELAIKAFDDAIEAYLFGASLNSGDIEVIVTPNTFNLGQQNYTAILQSDGSNFGTLVVTRKGKLVYSFLLAGPYIQYKQTLVNLIGPKLDLYEE